jgi:hypothetical protein
MKLLLFNCGLLCAIAYLTSPRDFRGEFELQHRMIDGMKGKIMSSKCKASCTEVVAQTKKLFFKN